MSKLRSVNTHFWSDPYIETLSPSNKLLFLYLITNEKTNMLGIYESSKKKISFETGLTLSQVDNGLKEFQKVGKVNYVENHIVLVNFLKHQKYNTNMKKSAIDTYNGLPNCLKDSTLSITKDNPSKGFESLLKHYGMVSKIEVEVEVEDEKEDKYKDIVDRYVKYINLFNKIKGTSYKPSKKDYNNFKNWVSIYNPSEIKQAITNHDSNFWAEDINPQWLLRTKDTKGQAVDYIGQLLNYKPNKMI